MSVNQIWLLEVKGKLKLARNLQLWTLLQTVKRYPAVYHRISEIGLAYSYFANT